MSSNSTRLPLAEARALAEEFLALVKPVAKRAEIAGSIRRGKMDIGDLEIVAQTTLQIADPLDTLLAELERRSVITPELRDDGKPRAWSSRYRAAYFKGMRLDLFIVRPDRDWGVTMLIRTGPGDANEYLVTRRTSAHAPGATPAHLAFRDGALWRLPYRHDFKLDRLLPGSVRIEAPEEADVYAALGMPYVQPEERTVETYQRVRGTVIAPLVVPVHTAPVRIATGRLNCGDPDALDITIGGQEDGRGTPLGAALAPTRSMVNAYKAGELTATQYEVQYLELLRWRYRAYPQVFLDILAARRVLTCYCGADGFCHRHLAADVLAKLATTYGIPVVLEGELTRTAESDTPAQMSMFGDAPPAHHHYE